MPTVNCVLLESATAATLDTVQPVEVPLRTKSLVETVAGSSARLNVTVYEPIVWYSVDSGVVYADSAGGVTAIVGYCVVVPAVTVAGLSALSTPLVVAENWWTLVALLLPAYRLVPSGITATPNVATAAATPAGDFAVKVPAPPIVYCSTCADVPSVAYSAVPVLLMASALGAVAAPVATDAGDSAVSWPPAATEYW